MKEYLNFVHNLAENRINKDFLNSGPIHASMVMSKIFQFSQKEIKIYCGGFSGAVSNDSSYLNNLNNFLNIQGSKIKILVEDYNSNKNSKVYNVLKNHKPKVEILETDLRINNSENDKPVHFTLGDGIMVRLETNPSDFSAEVNFNSPDAVHLDNIFDDMFSHSNNRIVTL